MTTALSLNINLIKPKEILDLKYFSHFLYVTFVIFRENSQNLASTIRTVPLNKQKIKEKAYVVQLFHFTS